MALVDRNQCAKMPEGYRAAPLREQDLEAPLRISVVVQNSGEKSGGPFVRVRDFAEGSAFLGCLEDRSGMVHSWLEIAVQHAENIGAANPAYRQALSNRVLDERWKKYAAQCAALEPGDVLWTGWEVEHPAPLLFDPAFPSLQRPADAESPAGWKLCVDDAVLLEAGLPAYSNSLCRYLVLEGKDGKRFAPVSPGAPANDLTVSATRVFGKTAPFNPAGGLMLVRTLAPLDFDEWADVLSGKPWKGIPRGKRPVSLGGAYATLRDENAVRFGGGHLLLTGRGMSGRLVETAHLKLHTIGSVLRRVEEALRSSQIPFLNLQAASIGISLGNIDSGLPILWSNQVRIVNPGDALALEIETTDARFFIPANFGENSVYRPAGAGVPVRARGEVRIRQVLPDSAEGTILEASLVGQERLNVSGNDLLCISLPLEGGPVALYGRIDPKKPASGEVHFRTEPQRFSAETVAALRQAEGAPFAKVPFQVLPVLSSPCDLYAIGVLAVRMLFVDNDQTLPVALDELMALSRLLSSSSESQQSLPIRVKDAVEKEERWALGLGPQRLLDETLSTEQALAVIPPRLWWEIVALVLRLFPGATPESFCSDLADAPELAIEKPFQAALHELDRVQRQLRGLIVFDNESHREIRSVIGKFLEGR